MKNEILVTEPKRKKSYKKISLIALAMSLCAIPAFAESGTSTTNLTFNFDPAQMFTWTNTMLSALMPVLYITLGIGLAFIIINALKYAFK